jgi:hypothetical protein
MDANAIFSLRPPPAAKPSVRRDGWLESIAIRLSLISQAIGFSGIGTMIIVDRPQADLDGFAGGSTLAVIGGISALLVGALFLVAAFLHWRFCARR